MDRPFDRLARVVSLTLRTPAAIVTVVDARQTFIGQHGLAEPFATERVTPLSYSFCKHVAASGAPLVIEDARVHPLVQDNPAIVDLGIVAYAGVPLRNEAGDVIGAVAAVDHEPRVWREDELAILTELAGVAAAELRWRVSHEVETRYRSLTQAASEAIVTTSEDSVITSANPAVEKIFGYAPSELIGQPLTLLIPERYRAAHVEGMRRYLATGERRLDWAGVELPGLRRNGEEVALAISFGEYVHDGRRVFTGVMRDVSAHRAAQEERDFLGEVSSTLSSSLDYETTLADVARLAVPLIADWCAVDLAENGGSRLVAVAHRDPAKEALVREYRQQPLDPDARGAVAEVIRTGRPLLYREIPESLQHDEHRPLEGRRLIRELGLRSAIIVPLRLGDRTLGALSLVTAESGRLYDTHDLELAEELARRAAIAVDHARLFRDLADTEAHYRRLVETSPVGVFVVDPRGCFTELNRAGEEILGRSAAAVLTHEFREMVAPESLPAAEDAFIRVLTEQDPNVEIDVVILRPSGERRLARVTITAIHDGAGVTGIHGVGRDITDERRMQEALAESERNNRLLIESLEDYAFFMLDAEGRVASWNAGAERLKGYARDEVIGQHLSTFYTPEDAAAGQAANALERAARDGRFEAEGWRVRKDGSRFHASAVITAVRGADGDLAGFAKVTRDVTERMEADRERRESELRDERMQALEQERSRLSALFENAPAFIAILEGPDHVFRVANEVYEQIIGHRKVIGTRLRDSLPDLAAQGFLDLLDRVYATGEPYIGRGVPIQLEQKPGAPLETRYVNFVYQPYQGPDGAIAGVFVHGVDVTELVQARHAAEAASTAKTEFLSRTSHELRTPLNAILGFGQLLELDARKPESVESVSQILSAGRHLLILIDEVLDIARIEGGQMSLSVEPVQVAGVIAESLGLVRPMAAREGVTLSSENVLTMHEFVAADQQRLKQVLLNLLSNAIKYNRAGGTVTVSCEPVGVGRLRISVRDTGPGLPPALLDRLFTPFDRLGAEQTGVAGTGLGLALSKGLVEAMGGTLGVESEPGRGSCFWVELAATSGMQTPEPLPVPEAVPVTTSHEPAATHTVLFIEDNLANVRLMERLFLRRPHVRLVTAMQGSLGVELARETRPDLILLDVNLPDTSGDKVLLQLRRDPALSDVPVVMISGDAIPSQVRRFLELGAKRYITKPFNIHELLGTVDELLG